MEWKDFRAPSLLYRRSESPGRVGRGRGTNGGKKRGGVLSRRVAAPVPIRLSSRFSFFVASATPTLSISLSLIVSHPPLLFFNVISSLSPSHVPDLPPVLTFPFSYFTHLIPPVLFFRTKFLFHLTFLQLRRSPSSKSTLSSSSFLSSPLFFTWPRSLYLLLPLPPPT